MKRKVSASVDILIGGMGLAIVFILDKFFFKRGIFAEGWPNFSLAYSIRSIVIFISLLALFSSLMGKKKSSLIFFGNKIWSIESLSLFATLSSSLLFLFLFLFNPLEFGRLSLEDGFIEWGSAVLLFGSCILFLLTTINNLKNLTVPKRIQFSLALLSVVFFIMGMEEVSWFQRVLNIQTPDLFKNSNQFELNLHNTKTNYFENAYYFGSFLYLVLFPFFRLAIPYVTTNDYLNRFIPRPFIGVIGSVVSAYNFDMWNIIMSQISFFGSAIILLAFAMFASQKNEKYLILSTFVILVCTQLLFLSLGEHFSRLWDVTEYKEFLIPLVFFVYAWDVFNSSIRQNTHPLFS